MSEVLKLIRKVTNNIPERGDFIATLGMNSTNPEFILSKNPIQKVVAIEDSPVLKEIHFCLRIGREFFLCTAIFSTTDYFRSQVKRNLQLDLTYDWKVFLTDITIVKQLDLEKEDS